MGMDCDAAGICGNEALAANMGTVTCCDTDGCNGAPALLLPATLVPRLRPALLACPEGAFNSRCWPV